MNGININSHLINGIITLLDVFIFGVPITLLHIIYPMTFGAVYVGFSGIYFAANGTNPIDEMRYIYPAMDYGNNPVTASVAVVLAVFLLVPAIHLLCYALNIARFWLVYAIYGRSKVSCWGKVLESGNERKPLELENN